MLPRRFEQVQGADGVDGEIRVRLARGPVMRRLRGGVDDDLDGRTEPGEQRVDRVVVADVHVLVPVILERLLQPDAGGRGGRLRAKKARPHVVVHSNHVKTSGVKTFARFGADQTGGTCDKGDAHAWNQA